MAAATTQNGAQTKPPEARLVDEVRGGVDDLVQLGRMEVELALLEAKSAGIRVGVGVGLVVAALVIAYAGFIYLLGALPENLGLLGHWWGWLVTGGALIILSVLIGLLGWSRFIKRAINEAKGTFETIKGDLEWLRQLANRG